jgi:Uma2 family endonuclease
VAYSVPPDIERKSLADLEAMPDDDKRYELIDGQIYMTPSASVRHQELSGDIYRQLWAKTPVGHKVFYAPLDLDLVADQRVVPDLLVVPETSLNEKRAVWPALLVVELTSPSTRGRDHVLKREVYAASEVAYYWLIDLQAGRALVHQLRPGTSSYEVIEEHDGPHIELSLPIPVSFDLG